MEVSFNQQQQENAEGTGSDEQELTPVSPIEVKDS